jgi:hypothetical protein
MGKDTKEREKETEQSKKELTALKEGLSLKENKIKEIMIVLDDKKRQEDKQAKRIKQLE